MEEEADARSRDGSRSVTPRLSGRRPPRSLDPRWCWETPLEHTETAGLAHCEKEANDRFRIVYGFSCSDWMRCKWKVTERLRSQGPRCPGDLLQGGQLEWLLLLHRHLLSRRGGRSCKGDTNCQGDLSSFLS